MMRDVRVTTLPAANPCPTAISVGLVLVAAEARQACRSRGGPRPRFPEKADGYAVSPGTPFQLRPSLLGHYRAPACRPPTGACRVRQDFRPFMTPPGPRLLRRARPATSSRRDNMASRRNGLKPTSPTGANDQLRAFQVALEAGLEQPRSNRDGFAHRFMTVIGADEQ